MKYSEERIANIKAGRYNDETRLAIKLIGRDVNRFWSKVNKNGPIPAHCPELGQCWEWKGKPDISGYGRFRVGKYTSKAHRVSYRIHIGDIEKELAVLHKCDNAICINPAHLYQGTQLQNSFDAKQRHRTYRPIGHKNVNAKFNDDIIREIIQYHKDTGFMHKDIAKKYKVVPSVITGIVNRTTWKHVAI